MSGCRALDAAAYRHTFVLSIAQKTCWENKLLQVCLLWQRIRHVWQAEVGE